MSCIYMPPDGYDCHSHKFSFQIDKQLHLLEIKHNHPEFYKALKIIFNKAVIETLEGLGEGWVYDEDGNMIQSEDRFKPIFKCTYFYHDVLDRQQIPYNYRDRIRRPEKFFYLYGKRLTKKEEEVLFISFYLYKLEKEDYEGCRKLREQARKRYPAFDFDKLHAGI